MTPRASAVSILDQAGQALGGFLPRLGGAIVLLLVGLLVARLLGSGARRGLTAIGVDRLAAPRSRCCSAASCGSSYRSS